MSGVSEPPRIMPYTIAIVQDPEGSLVVENTRYTFQPIRVGYPPDHAKMAEMKSGCVARAKMEIKSRRTPKRVTASSAQGFKDIFYTSQF